MTTRPQRKHDAKPARLGRLSMSGLSLEDALRGAMQVHVPPAKAKGGRRKSKRKKG